MGIGAAFVLAMAIGVLPLVPTRFEPRPTRLNRHSRRPIKLKPAAIMSSSEPRQIGTYGHSYAVYGTAGGRPNYADLHPMGGYAVMALGHVYRSRVTRSGIRMCSSCR